MQVEQGRISLNLKLQALGSAAEKAVQAEIKALCTLLPPKDTCFCYLLTAEGRIK